jgi:tripartite-type tricarboxylate transporter receptor subunit TctC
MKLNRRAVAATCLVLAAGSAVAQVNYPKGPITLVVPFAAGSGTDIATRSLAKYLSQALTVPVVVENKPGANGAIGAQFVARAKPDGQTLLVGSATTNAANFAFYPGKLGYVPGSFDIVAGMVGGSLALHVPAAAPWKNVGEMVAAAKNGGGKAFACGSGNAVTQVACEIFKRQAGIEATTVPYKSNPQSLTDLVGGQISFAFSDTAASQPLVQGGRLRILGFAGTQRNDMFPQVPTLAEQGLPGMLFTAWTAVFAPAQTPGPVLEKLNTEINKWIESPDATQLRAASGSFPLRMDLPEARRFASSEVGRWARYIKESNVRPE